MSDEKDTTDRWADPMQVSDAEVVFGIRPENMPSIEEIPEDFRIGNGEARKWHRVFDQMFFGGFTQEQIDALYTKKDEREALALGHLRAIATSYAPKHEHKQATVAWLMSRWLSPDWEAWAAAGGRV